MEVCGVTLTILGDFVGSVRLVQNVWGSEVALAEFSKSLGIERSKFENTCVLLLEEIIPESDPMLLMKAPGGPLWSDHALQEKLESRLDPVILQMFLRGVSELNSTLHNLRDELGLDKIYKLESRFLRKALGIIRRIISRGRYEELLSEVCRINSNLAILVKDIKMFKVHSDAVLVGQANIAQQTRAFTLPQVTLPPRLTLPPEQSQKSQISYMDSSIAIKTPQNLRNTDLGLELVGAAPINYDDYKLKTEFHDEYVAHTTYDCEILQERSIWRQEKIVGTGISGEVWLEKGVGKELRAVKRLGKWSTEMTCFHRELLALIEVRNYPHLFLRFFGWYENKHYLFLAMEYIEHGHLGEYMRDSHRAKSDAKEITRQILEGLEVLHGKGICHRDLKPENILVASTNPIWVKIADFGISKQTENTILRTNCGTEGYLAPELRGVLPRRMVKKGVFTHALDLWSLGCLLHELLTSHKPFFSVDDDENDDYSITDSDIGFTGSSLGPTINIKSLIAYCTGNIEFPSKFLKESQVSEEGIDFVRSLLTPHPKHRPTAANALQNPWLSGYKSSLFETLRHEFSCLGVNLDLGSNEGILIRQISKIDIMQFFPDFSEERIQSMLLESAAGGYNSVISALLHSPSCESIDNVIRGKLFQIASEAGQLDTVKVLLRNNIDVGALIGNQTVLHWAVEAGHHNTAAIIQGGDREGGLVALQTVALGEDNLLDKGVDAIEKLPMEGGQVLGSQ